jgi:phage shock protein B
MSGFVFTLIFVPLMAFIVVVLPLAITLWFRDRNRQSHALTGEEWTEVRRMLEATERLESRIRSLEAILDSENKGWRNPS